MRILRTKQLQYALFVMKLRFADFEFDDVTGELTTNGQTVALQPQPAKVLRALTRRSGEVVTRTELQTEVWGDDTHVDFDQGLNWCIRRLREVIGDTATDSKFIQTLPKRGYRFVARVEAGTPVVSELPASRWPRWTIALASVLAVLGLATGIIFKEREQRTKLSTTVLVLPFDNVSATQSGPEFQEIASDQLIAKLAEIDPKHLSVIDPMTARKFKNTKECMIEIGNKLGADFVLTGEVNPGTEAVYVHAQLFQVSTNRRSGHQLETFLDVRVKPRYGKR